ncbi:MAG TPA: PTS sugar transporter subunit IIA [Gemmataceae bacterium]|nr:PTS sugar transporter subunit IIA [Gemmataceae bacterium]
MNHEMMSVEQLAVFLHRDAREVHKWASKGNIPVHKVRGEYRFHPAEIHHWLEGQLPGYTELELSNLERGAAGHGPHELPLLTGLMSPATMAVPLPATTKASVLKELVIAAEQSWHVYDPAAILDAIKQREEVSSTALETGVAIPHPHRPLANALGESLIAFGRTASAIPFGDPRGGLTDLFFLVCCRDAKTHVQVLARLARLMLLPGFLDNLRGAETPAAAYQVIETAEAELLV